MHHDDKADFYNHGTGARFGMLGGRVKLVVGAFAIFCCWLSIGLGFVAFGLFLFVHILLQENKRFARQEFVGDIKAPLEGRIQAIRQDRNGLQIDIAGHHVASQIIYAPITSRVEDKLWIDGTYLPFDDATMHPLRARYDFLLETKQGHLITLSLFGGTWTRYIYAPFAEGQYVALGEPFAFGLIQSLITLQLPKDYEALVAVGDDIIAKQTTIAQRPLK